MGAGAADGAPATQQPRAAGGTRRAGEATLTAPFGEGGRVWTVEEANAALPGVTQVVERVRELRRRADEGAKERRARVRGNGHERDDDVAAAFAEAVRELGEEGIVLRDADSGLVDFPARSPSGRPYWLCWVVGEPEVGWWHWPEDGFAGRTPISEPPE